MLILFVLRGSNLTPLSREDINIIEGFVCKMYERNTIFNDVNKCRRYLFASKSRSSELCPPTYDALLEHIKRAQLQAA